MIDLFSLKMLEEPLQATDIRGDAEFQRVSTDTRSLLQGDLFVALSGPNFNGNGFVKQAAEKGACAAVVTELQNIDLPQLLVADSRQALGAIARLNRQRYQGKLVAITGSSGKTTVKEMLAAILATQGEVLATRGNLNNEIGVPLTLLELNAQHRYAVIELGASGLGEIAYTAGLAQPDVALLNNAGGAHLEGFGSLQGVVQAKGEIFEGLGETGIGIVNLDDDNADFWLKQLQHQKRLSFSLHSTYADLFASHLESYADGCYGFVLNTHNGQITIRLSVLGRHMASNALAAAAAANALGVDLAAIQQGLQAFQGVPGRLAVSAHFSGARIIDDSYNANPDSVKAAIRVLKDLPGQRVLVLGNMAELGDDTVALHQQVGQFAAENGIDLLLASGDLAAAAAETFKSNSGQARSFESNELLSDWLLRHVNKEMVILVKGSRSAGMETVIKALSAEGNE
ncbi:MAG: UDP-N-acetylmuramoyl-tripeptide--D-alanyl-D-alanine ligase [Motiliproteus sp.]